MMLNELLAYTRNGGAIVGPTQNGMVDLWRLKYLPPERVAKLVEVVTLDGRTVLD